MKLKGSFLRIVQKAILHITFKSIAQQKAFFIFCYLHFQMMISLSAFGFLGSRDANTTRIIYTVIHTSTHLEQEYQNSPQTITKRIKWQSYKTAGSHCSVFFQRHFSEAFYNDRR